MTYLANLPVPFFNESTCSWIQRVCQVYAITYSGIYQILDAPLGRDPDINLTNRYIDKAICIGRLPWDSFALMRATLCRIAEVHSLRRLLLRQEAGLPLYRFCPQCLAEDHTPYLRIEWRFKAWEICPKHMIRLPVRCHQCQNILQIQRTILAAQSGPPPILSLAYCYVCRTDLRKASGQHIECIDPDKERQTIKFQMAVLSAVVHGYMKIEPFDEKFSLHQMVTLLHGVGLEAPDAASSRVLSKFGRGDRGRLRWLIHEALKGAFWLQPEHPKRAMLARTGFNVWNRTYLDDVFFSKSNVRTGKHSN
jgi:hypothetical protein